MSVLHISNRNNHFGDLMSYISALSTTCSDAQLIEIANGLHDEVRKRHAASARTEYILDC